MQIVWLVNWNSNNADFQFQTAPTSFINQGVISGLAVTLNQVAVGSALISVTSNGQTWLITYHNTSLVTIDTSGTKKVWIEVTQAKIDNGVSNNEDGTGIAFINTGASYPWSGSYIPLASIASGVITDDRVFISMKAIKRKAMTAHRLIYIDASGNEQELAYGTAGQVLSSAGVSSVPIWASPSVDIHGQTLKWNPKSADEIIIADSENGFILKRVALGSWLSPFGNGSDWNVTISTNTTLVRDMYYQDLTINSTIVLNTNGYRVYVAGTLTNNGIIRRNWNAWWVWTYAWFPTWWVAWAILNQWSLNAEVAGWDGWSFDSKPWVAWGSANPSYTTINWASWWNGAGAGGGSQVGGAGWTSTRWALYNVIYNVWTLISQLANPASFTASTTQYKWPSGSGWGGCDWAPNAWCSGGGAWSNGWFIWIAANTLNNTSWVIESKWWAGWAWVAANPKFSGGGGGGQWGVIMLIYQTLTALGTTTVTWWAGGASGGGGATAGWNGNAGVVIQVPITL